MFDRLSIMRNRELEAIHTYQEFHVGWIGLQAYTIIIILNDWILDSDMIASVDVPAVSVGSWSRCVVWMRINQNVVVRDVWRLEGSCNISIVADKKCTPLSTWYTKLCQLGDCTTLIDCISTFLAFAIVSGIGREKPRDDPAGIWSMTL